MSTYCLRENRRTGREDVVIEDARLIWRNFSGKESPFNRAGNRVVTVLIYDPEFADELSRLGWNVKRREPRDEGDDPFFTLECTVSYKIRPPKIMTYSGRHKASLNEDTVSSLDYAEIVNCDLILNGSPWEVNGNHGVKAYVSELHATLEESVFGDKYDDYE